MRVAISHETVYRYSGPVNYSVQYLRLTPLSGPTQRVLNWKISAPGTLSPWIDGFGNAGHTLVVDQPHEEVRVTATGEVEISDGVRPLGAEGEPHAPMLYLRSTRLTEADDAIVSFASRFKPDVAHNPQKGLDRLMTGLRETVDYQPNTTTAATTAHQALEKKTGVCQDHAHLFVSCCRTLGLPSRYVSGYLCSSAPDGARMASHAWAETWVEGSGWMSYDVTNGKSNANSHVRVAIGLDYLDAAPVRGFRRGGGGEEMAVDVTVGDADTVHAARELARLERAREVQAKRLQQQQQQFRQQQQQQQQ